MNISTRSFVTTSFSSASSGFTSRGLSHIGYAVFQRSKYIKSLILSLGNHFRRYSQASPCGSINVNHLQLSISSTA